MRTLARSLVFVTLAASFVPSAHAGAVVGIEGMTATVMQREQSSFSGIGLRARVRSTQLIEKVEFLPFIEYWRNTSTVQPFNIKSSRSDATIGSDIRYIGEWKGMKPYAGAGIGLHFLSSEVEAPDLGLPHGQNSIVKGGLSFMGGANFALAGKLENFIELKYHHVPSFSQLKIHMGLTYNL